jgi:hypothetical protein
MDREEIISSVYDIAIVALGYERRSSHLATILRTAPHYRYAIPFETHRELSFDANCKALSKLRYEKVTASESQLAEWATRTIDQVSENTVADKLHICIDISSFTRLRLAYLLEGIVSSNAKGKSLEVDFVYTPAQYTKPPRESEGATVCGPVSSFFAGWPSDPELPVAAIIGLGYEREKAVGAYEYLEPTSTALVKPVSHDPRYDSSVKSANESLFLDQNSAEVFTYPIDHAAECVELVNALVQRYQKDHRVITVPFGPKLFALCCMIVACVNYPRIGVWRISADCNSNIRDQVASEYTVALKVVFSP